MRIIGHLPNEESAQRFSDFLVVEGIANEVEPDQGKWAVWIHGEDEIDKAKTFLDAYQKAPSDPRFRHHARQARLKREQETKDREEAERRQIDGRRVFRQGAARAGAFTLVLIAISVAVAIYSNVGKDTRRLGPLLISEEFHKEFNQKLPEVRRGEVWRLFSPVLIHFGFPHLIFNMLGLYALGGMIEHVRGPVRLAWLVALIAIASNLGQFFYSGPAFGGMSGVVYGLFGYVWMKATLDPWSGLYVHPQTVIMLMVWFFLCMTPWMPFQAANMAHAVGLVVGVVWGVISGTLRRS